MLELLHTTRNAGLAGEELVIQCDSQYVINSLTKWMAGWKKRGWRKADGKPVLNADLMEELDQALVGRPVRFEWVRGHVGHPMNEAADARARAAATAFQRGGPVPAGPGWPGVQNAGADGANRPGDGVGSTSEASGAADDVVPGATAARRARLRQENGTLF